MNFSERFFGPKVKPEEPWTGFPVPKPEEITSVNYIRDLVPDVLPPASNNARREAAHMARHGQPDRMVLNPKLASQQQGVIICLIMLFQSDLPGFVTMPIIAYLFDEWFVEGE